MSSKEKKYAEDGVNVVDEASFSSFAGNVCKDSYNNSPFVEVHDLSQGSFRGPRPVTFKNLPDGYLIEATTDSIGTKGIINDAAKMPETSAYDLVAMTATDITRFGGMPLMFINILDVAGVGKEGDETNAFYKALLSGLAKAAKEAQIVVSKGETAQVAACVGSDNANSPTRYNWGATLIGAYHQDKMITGESVASGQKVIAIKENGFRCNGFSSVRKAFALQYGDRWYENNDAKEDIRLAAAPSVLADIFLNTLHGWYAKDWKPEMTIHAIQHITGGGIIEKFGNDLVLKKNLSATLDNLFEPPEIMKKCASWRGVADEEFYETWNGGQGILVVVDAKDSDTCVDRAKEFDLDAQVCGEITKETTPTLTIHSKLEGSVVKHTG